MSVSVTFWGNLADAASQLRETRFAESLLHGGGGQPSLRLVDAALGIGARLIHAEPALPDLFLEHGDLMLGQTRARLGLPDRDRKSTRLNSSHGYISYAVFCLKKKKKKYKN